MADRHYKEFKLKRVYYSGYIPINGQEKSLPAIGSAPPLLRENRLYQSDWLMRFYGFDATELVDEKHPNLDFDVDPKLSWALRHPEQYDQLWKDYFHSVNIQARQNMKLHIQYVPKRYWRYMNEKSI